MGDEYFIFADTSNLVCWHNLHFTRCIVSSGYAAALQSPEFRDLYLKGTADYLPFIANGSRSVGFVSLFTLNATSLYTVEYDAEITRRREFPTVPSRLSAVYAFASMDDCHKAHSLYGWDMATVRQFRLSQDELTRVHRANMQVVSLMRSCYPMATWSEADRVAVWQHYWKGRGAMSIEVPVLSDGKPTRQSCDSGEIWEYLIEGKLELVDAA